MAGRFVLAVAALALGACATQGPPSTTVSAGPQVATADALDPFVVMIGAERWGVIIDRARAGVRRAPGEPDRALIENEMYRADAGLKSGAAALVELRNEVCERGLVTGDSCEFRDWPGWTSEPPTADTPIEEIERRSHWLGEAMQPFTTVGCEAGRRATNEELFCSVE